ncbi:polysaccharide lyase family 8 super-sandwich domain-containing protein [Streptobacillus moniliformis]|uniref:polysaccharide lyase family 8 super-sandwich domain-containing protein n=1 Tax=Streptobacillus moniliformis TaxID=34105 RepID=UPI0007E47367|nr:polysaccharide lyase family 8 super-sandwich domain-containing protein [Streptobacillus moniliformis]
MYELLLKRREYLIGNFKDLPLNKRKQIEEIQEKNIEKLEYLENLNIAEVKLKYNNILELAKAYNQVGNVRYRDEKIKVIILKTLKLLRITYYNLSSVEKVNWWQWEIGIPLLLNDIFILMNEKDFDFEKEENLKTSIYFQKDPRYSGNNPVATHPSKKPFRISTGGNRVDTVKVSLFRSILLNNEEELKLALNSLPEVWKCREKINSIETDTQRDGFYNDGSFIQHGSLAYNGTYGNVLLQGIGEILYVIGDSKYLKYLGDIYSLKDIILNSYKPFMYKGSFPDMLNGRAITRENSSDKTIGHMLLNSIMLISCGLNDEELKNLVASEILKYEDYSYFDKELSPFMYDLVKKNIHNRKKEEYGKIIKVSNIMNRVFIKDDKKAIAIAGHSENISNYESINGENTKGWYTGDGMIYLYTSDVTYTNYWNNSDTRYMSGTTEVYEDLNGINTSQTLNVNMSSAKIVKAIEKDNKMIFFMEFENHNKSLKMYKSYVYTGKKLICLNTNIDTKEKIYTTIDNRLYKEKPKIVMEDKRILINDLIFNIITDHKFNFDIKESEFGYFVKIWIEHKYNENLYYEIIFEYDDKTSLIEDNKENIIIRNGNEKYLINIKEKEVLRFE